MNPAETKLRSLVSGLGMPALEALASKGLVRRAQKDLERGVPVSIEREDKGTVYLKVEQCEVSIPEAGPAKGKCSCAATGVCQHMIAAVLFLQRAGPSAEATGISAEEEVLSFTREQLEAWAGKATVRAALELAAQSPVEVVSERGLVIRFPDANAQCHYAAGAGLDGIIVSGSVKDKKRIAVAAVIVFQKLKGLAWEVPERAAATPDEPAGAPRSPSEVLDIALQLFIELLDNGLARISTSTQQRLATLAVSALGVNLPRLSLALRGLADECSVAIARDATADLGRMLTRMAQAYALCVALRRGGADSRPELAGWRRTQYEELGSLDLIGASAWPWRTASGFTGLTLLFWDTGSKRWNSWSESRPGQQLDFQPVARYTQPGPWEGAESPRQLAHSSFRLMNARRNPANRLSGSGRSRVLVTERSNLIGHELPIFGDWAEVSRALDSRLRIGLKEANPLDAIFALNPATWGQRAFDPVTQVFSWVLLDAQGRALAIEIGFDAFSAPAIRYLESVAVNSLEGAVVIGRVQKTGRRAFGGVSLQAYSIHRKSGEVVHLCLDHAAPASSPAAMAPVGDDEEFEVEEQFEAALTPGSAVGSLLDEADEALLIAAEAGTAGVHPARIERLNEVAMRAERMGLRGLAFAVRSLVAQPGPYMVLRCSYLGQLYRRAMSIS